MVSQTEAIPDQSPLSREIILDVNRVTKIVSITLWKKLPTYSRTEINSVVQNEIAAFPLESTSRKGTYNGRIGPTQSRKFYMIIA